MAAPCISHIIWTRQKTTGDTPDDEEHEDAPAPKNYVSFYLAPRIDDD